MSNVCTQYYVTFGIWHLIHQKPDEDDDYSEDSADDDNGK